ncbi:MAG: class I SAM-dependent RNA methyltransferase [Candidatus Aminicenantes bacterium]|nr:MAG: class I SAM-dependent RNA methyltransferase [Candidatus Aminicenantes bacterium]
MRSHLDGIGYGHLCSKIIPSPLKDGYRNRAKFKIYPRDGKIELKGTDPIQGEVPYEEALWILPEWGRAVVKQVADIISSGYPAFPVDGFELQLTHGRKEAHTTLSVKRSIVHPYSELAQTLLAEISAVKGIAVPSQKSEFGEAFLNHSLLNTDILAHYDAFFQSNLHLTPELLTKVTSICVQTPPAEIVDVYCGVGLFSLFIGKKGSRILGVDNDKKAIESARRNAAKMGLKKASYVCSSAEEFVEGHDPGCPDIILIDPPRAGCQPQVISSLARVRSPKICLVSCAIDTHVRDLVQWSREGYVPVSFQALDMFPFTEFIETVTLLNRQ